MAGAASTNNGSGAVTLVVADKNLVPSPYGNIQRATGILSDSGEHQSKACACVYVCVPPCLFYRWRASTTVASAHASMY